MNKAPFLELRNIKKSFYATYALKDVSLKFNRGEVHIICGENGAGKSTLMKILSGAYTKDEGCILMDGEEVQINNPLDSERLGIAIVYQEFNLSPTVSIAENIFMNREFGKFFVDRKTMHKEAQRLLDMVGADVSPSALVKHLSAANIQLVQIAKALSQNARIIVLDEPCSSLTEDETENLFKLIRKLREDGALILYIDHRIENFQKIGDLCTVLRDGAKIQTLRMEYTTREEIIRLMVSRELGQMFDKTSAPADETVLDVRHISNDKLRDVSFSVRKGEVFGFAGLVGAGRTELLKVVFGIDKYFPGGEIYLEGEKTRIKTVKDAIACGMAYIPEDRKREGFIPGRTVDYNLSIVCIDKMGKGPFVKKAAEKEKVNKQKEQLKVKSLNSEAVVSVLSGGNQQKVVIGKWLIQENMKILIMDEPTKGIDVGVKFEIYKLIDELANRGVTILLVTSELPELIGLCDRIATIKEGKLTGIIERKEFSQEAIMRNCV